VSYQNESITLQYIAFLLLFRPITLHMANSVKNNHFLYRLLRNFDFAEKKSNVIFMYIFSILALKAEYLSALNVKFYHFLHLH